MEAFAAALCFAADKYLANCIKILLHAALLNPVKKLKKEAIQLFKKILAYRTM
jgi:hypothetical protein